MVFDNIGLIKEKEIVNVERHIGKITGINHVNLKELPSLEIQVWGALSGPVRAVPGIIPKEYVNKEVFFDIATSSINHNPYLGALILRVYEISDKKESPGRVIAQNTTIDYKVNL